MINIGAAAAILPPIQALTAHKPADWLLPISSPVTGSYTRIPSRNSFLRVMPRFNTSAAATAQNGMKRRAIGALKKGRGMGMGMGVMEEGEMGRGEEEVAGGRDSLRLLSISKQKTR